MSTTPFIYWDHNASAPLRKEVAALLSARLSSATECGANASSVHQAGRAARLVLESARERIAKVLGIRPKELCFTASGSEANALALKGAFFARADPAFNRVVVSSLEHPSLLAAAAQLSRHGAEVTHIPPRQSGRVAMEDFLPAPDSKVALCSLMWANNETGVLQPVAELAAECRRRGILFHTDAVQAVGKVPVSFREVDADLLSFSGHKLGGPTGIAALVARGGIDIEALTPGHQEEGRRGGTANPYLAEALALALELSVAERQQTAEHLEGLKHRFESTLLSRIAGAHINGAKAPRIPNTSNVRFEGTDAEGLLIALDLEGICASSGAACASGSLSPSHALLAMGLSKEEAKSSIRFSLGSHATQEEVDRVLGVLEANVLKQRTS